MENETRIIKYRGYEIQGFFQLTGGWVYCVTDSKGYTVANTSDYFNAKSWIDWRLARTNPINKKEKNYEG